MEPRELSKEISDLRKELKILSVKNQQLKQELAKKRAVLQAKTDQRKVRLEDQQLAQKTLQSFAGFWATVKEGRIEVQFTPCNNGVPGQQYEMIIFEGEGYWQVGGYRLPLSISNRQGIKVYSLEEVGKLVRGVQRDVQAFIERKGQVELSERILERTKAAIWYSVTTQNVILRIPHDEQNGLHTCEIHLAYDVSHTLPNKVLLNAEGLEEDKLDRLRQRMNRLLKTYPLPYILDAEFGDHKELEDGSSGSLLSQLEAV